MWWCGRFRTDITLFYLSFLWYISLFRFCCFKDGGHSNPRAFTSASVTKSAHGGFLVEYFRSLQERILDKSSKMSIFCIYVFSEPIKFNNCYILTLTTQYFAFLSPSVTQGFCPLPCLRIFSMVTIWASKDSRERPKALISWRKVRVGYTLSVGMRWINIIQWSKMSYKNDGVDGWGQMQTYFISHLNIIWNKAVFFHHGGYR